jgi:hypothetical protein
MLRISNKIAINPSIGFEILFKGTVIPELSTGTGQFYKERVKEILVYFFI